MTTTKRIFLAAGGGLLALLTFASCAGDEASAPTSVTAETSAKPTAAPSKTAEVPAEYEAALGQAKTYAEAMNMSKAGIRDQLVSEYGGKFPKEAADWAMSNLTHDWKANALASAKIYREDMHMSNADIRDQLVSEYGGQFTEAEADYAMKNLP